MNKEFSLVIYPNPILREKSKQVLNVNQDIIYLAEEMSKLMHSNFGIGLSAPQVGENLNICILSKDLFKEKFKDVLYTKKGDLILINPKIVKHSKEKIIDEEGCLSLPGIFKNVKRYKSIELNTFNGKIFKTIFLKDLQARVAQHEIDHLKGILIIDYN